MKRLSALALLALSALLLGVAAAQAKPLPAANRAYVNEVVAAQMQEGRPRGSRSRSPGRRATTSTSSTPTLEACLQIAERLAPGSLKG
jgi:hypothetical protein